MESEEFFSEMMDAGAAAIVSAMCLMFGLMCWPSGVRHCLSLMCTSLAFYLLQTELTLDSCR